MTRGRSWRAAAVATACVVAGCAEREGGVGGMDGAVEGDSGVLSDGGSADAGTRSDSSAADGAPGDAGASTGGCRIDLPMPGFDPLFAMYTDPFDSEDFDAMAGWVEMNVEIMTVIGPMNSPVVSCTTGAGTFRVEAEGTEQDGVDETRMVIGLGAGYSGPGTYTAGTADGLEAEVFHSDVGAAEARTAAVCQICVEPGERSGLYRCRDLEDTAGGRLNVFQAAFRCE